LANSLSAGGLIWRYPLAESRPVGALLGFLLWVTWLFLVPRVLIIKTLRLVNKNISPNLEQLARALSLAQDFLPS